MKEIKRKALLFLVSLLFVFTTIQAQDISFEYLGIDEGLSQNSVTSIAQDSIGRIWIATRDGLNVYDGHKIKTFRPIRGDSTSLLGHFLTQIVEDRNVLWVVSKDGISSLDLKSLTIKRFPGQGYRTILPYRKHVLVGTKNGIYNLDTKSKEITRVSHILKEDVQVNHLRTDKSGILWICTENGLYAYYADKNSTARLIDAPTTCIFTDSKKQIWVGTSSDGVYLLNHKQEIIHHFKHIKNKPSSIVNNVIRDIKEDPNGNIWIGTFLGLNVINGNDHSISNYVSNHDDKSLSHNSIYSILCDKQGSMWLGTYFGGISYFNADFDIYRKYKVDVLNKKGVSYGVVGEMIEDDNRNLWIATEGGGLNYFNRSNNTFRHYKYKEGVAGLSHDNIKSLALKDRNTLLIGTHNGGLNVLDIKTGRVKVFKNDVQDSTSISSNIVNEILAYGDCFLLGTISGIVQYNPESNAFSPFIVKNNSQLENARVNCLFEDSFGSLWIGTETQGLFSYEKESGELIHYETLANDLSTIGSNNIACIYEDHQFRLWIGTQGGGLNLYHRDEGSFANYNMAHNGLPSDFIQGIKESYFGHLWIATTKGLSRLDVEKKQLYNYSKANGFPLSEVNSGALYLTSDKEVFVGGLNGLISFNEDKMLNRTSHVDLSLTSLFVNNKEVVPGDQTGILYQDLPYTKEITLKPGQNVFTIHFSACNYVSTNQNSYEYRLENFNTNWITTDGKSGVTYTNLNPGTYKLAIRATSGVENDVIDQQFLIINIQPPLYRTWYAIVFYVVLIIIVITWLNGMYRSRIRLEDKVNAEQREKEQLRNLNQSKLNFFTNISHEFRTPLTLITGTLESIMEDSKTRAENYNKLKKTYYNAERLNNLITELLDFRKLEHGNLQLKVTENSLVELMKEVYQSFTGYAQHHQIIFQFEPTDSALPLWFDKAQMEKVFYNIISNAFKIVDDKTGLISINLKEEDRYVDVLIEDNGVGMSSEETKNIFDLYFQIDNMQAPAKGKGSGIGLALCKSIMEEHKGEILVHSEKGKGTSFTVRILKNNSHFSEIDLVEDELVLSSKLKPLLGSIDKEEDKNKRQHPTNAAVVLVVEDNKEVQDLLKGILGESYKLLFANDGIEGLEAAIHNQPDLIISDVMMPNMSGTEMCLTLKRNIQTSHIPIILLTARASVDYKVDGFEVGADDYITKPFNTQMLKARVKNILHNRFLLQEKFKQDPKAKTKEVVSNSLDHKLLEQARKIIENNLDNTDFDIQDFAKAMNLGRTRLYTKIKGVTGQTPNDFILSIRLKKAAEMLMQNNENMNVSEIAYSVGFSTPRYFSRCFRQHFGVSPSKYGHIEKDEM